MNVLEALSRSNIQVERDIEIFQEQNHKKRKIEEKLSKLYEGRALTDNLLKLVEHNVVVGTQVAKQYKNQRLNTLTDEIERNLEMLLPQEGFKARIEYNTIKDNHYANLYIGKDNKWFLPKAQNGKFLQQLISFSVMYSINKLRGCKVIFSDEALSSADPHSLTEIKPLIEELIEEGFQMVIIEHKEEMYNKIERKEFRLYKDRDLDMVANVETVEIGGEDIANN